MSDVFKKFDVFLQDDKSLDNQDSYRVNNYRLGELTDSDSKSIINEFQTIIADLKNLDFSSDQENLQSQTKIMADIDKLKTLNQSVQLANGTYNSLLIQELLKSLLAKIQDPDSNISIEKQFKLLQMLLEDQKEFRNTTLNANQSGSKGGININVNNSSTSEGSRMISNTNTVEQAMFQKAEIKGIEGLLESTKIIENALIEKIGNEESLKELQTLGILPEKELVASSESKLANNNSRTIITNQEEC